MDGLEGVETIADDILVYGTGDTLEEAVKKHDDNMLTLLERCRERKFKMNKSKFHFKMNAVTYHGHVISDTRLKADPSKVQAMVEMERPEDAKAVKRLLGMVNYLAKFCPHLSTVSEPLRNLTIDFVPFIWSDSHEQTFSSLKRMLSVAPVLRYYSLDEEVTVEADSSDYGLGAVLLQAGQPVAFASRTLSQTKRNYSQMEKECLAITFACNRFDQYLHGRDYVTILTDHQNLETIFKKPILAAPKRLQRMRLRLQKYHIDVKYQRGKHMYISDALSRATMSKHGTTKENLDYEIYAVESELKFA